MRNLARELELSPNLNIELNNTDVLSDAVDSMIEKLSPLPHPYWHGCWTISTSALPMTNAGMSPTKSKNFGRNIFDESYIERGEGFRLKLRSPEAIKLYRDVLREMETDALEQMKGFYDQFEGELDGHALVPEDLKGGARGIGSYFPQVARRTAGGQRCHECHVAKQPGRCQELGYQKHLRARTTLSDWQKPA